MVMSFGVYVHIPYCVKKCPYCDFNSWGVGSLIPEKQYTGSVIKEAALYARMLESEWGCERKGGGERVVDTVFFGGGTPSLFSPSSIERILNSIFRYCSTSQSPEITVEVNPKTARLEKLRALRSIGVNRLSIGVQSFSARKLGALGRINSPQDSRRVLEDARRAGFDNVSIDLMFGVEGESLAEWQEDLSRALDFAPQHISCYCLTIEDGTAFGALYARGDLELPGEELTLAMLAYTRRVLSDRGYTQYEISNYARPGYESRHNLLYWRGEGYLGLGAGAHSHAGTGDGGRWGARWANVASPELYMKKLRDGEKPIVFRETLTRREALDDAVLMGLRLKEGVDLGAIERGFGARLRRDEIGSLIRGGHVELEGGRLRFSEDGFMLADELIRRVSSSLTLCPV